MALALDAAGTQTRLRGPILDADCRYTLQSNINTHPFLFRGGPRLLMNETGAMDCRYAKIGSRCPQIVPPSSARSDARRLAARHGQRGHDPGPRCAQPIPWTTASTTRSSRHRRIVSLPLSLLRLRFMDLKLPFDAACHPFAGMAALSLTRSPVSQP